jgi:hypothetical protein
MENLIEHHKGSLEAIRTALEVLTDSGGSYLVSVTGCVRWQRGKSFDNYVYLIYNHGGIEHSLAGS